MFFTNGKGVIWRSKLKKKNFLPFRQVGSNNSTKTDKQICEMLVDYSVSGAGKQYKEFCEIVIRFSLTRILLTHLRPIFYSWRNQRADLHK